MNRNLPLLTLLFVVATACRDDARTPAATADSPKPGSPGSAVDPAPLKPLAIKLGSGMIIDAPSGSEALDMSEVGSALVTGMVPVDIDLGDPKDDESGMLETFEDTLKFVSESAKSFGELTRKEKRNDGWVVEWLDKGPPQLYGLTMRRVIDGQVIDCNGTLPSIEDRATAVRMCESLRFSAK